MKKYGTRFVQKHDSDLILHIMSLSDFRRNHTLYRFEIIGIMTSCFSRNNQLIVFYDNVS